MIRKSIFLIALLATSAVHAQTPPDSIDLATVIQLARGDNPRLVVEEQDVAIARADRMTAGARPNPSVSFTGSHQPGEITNYEGRGALDGTIELPLLLGGQRSARIRAADQGIVAARSRLAATGNELAAEAGAAFVNLLVAQKKRDLQARNMQELDRLREIVAGRRAAGMASEYDLLRIDVALETWRTELAETETDVITAQAELAGQLGYAGWKPLAVGELLPAMVGPTIESENLAIIAARDEQKAATAGVEVARRERFPEVSLNAGHFRTTNPFGPTYSAGLTVEIPLFDRRKGAVRRAEAEAQAAALRRQLIEAQVQTDIDRLSAQVDNRAAALARFERQIAPRMPALKQMAEDSYRLSGGSIVELLDATRTLFETQAAHLELIGKLVEAKIRLQGVRGEFSPVVDR